MFRIENSVTVDELVSLKEKAIIPVAEVLSDFPRVDVEDKLYERLSNGVKLYGIELPDTPFSVYCRGELFGLGEARDDGSLKIKTYLKDND